MTFNFEQLREVKTVYDEKGQMYAWYGEHIESGYVVQPIYEVTSTYWCDGHEVPDYDVSYGDYTILEKMYEKPPKAKYESKIQELQKEIKALEKEIEEKKRNRTEMQRLDSLTPSDIIKEKLKGLNIPEIDTIAKALTGELELYSVSPEGRFISRACDYVAIHLGDKAHPVHFFKKVGSTWEKYNCNNVQPEVGHVSFTTLEMAERYLLNKIIIGNNYGSSIRDCLLINDLFTKYNEEAPESWTNYVKDVIDKEIEGEWERILMLYDSIKTNKNAISEHEKIVKKFTKLTENGKIPTEKEFCEIINSNEQEF